MYSRIICENIAPDGGSTTVPAGKCGKFGSRGSSSASFACNFFSSSVGGNEWKKCPRKNRKRAQFSMRMRGSYLSSILAENLFSIRSLASLIF